MRHLMGFDRTRWVTANIALAVSLAGCGGSAAPHQAGSPTTPLRTTPLRTTPSLPSTPSAPHHSSGASLSIGALRERIQGNVERTGSPEDPDTKCEARKLRFGATANVAKASGDQVAKQLHILCPSYFVPIDQAGQPDSVQDASPTSTTFKRAREECNLFPAAEIAKEYGGDPSDPASIARAYAERTHRRPCGRRQWKVA